MPADLVIRGGTVFDGRGTPGGPRTSRSTTASSARSGRACTAQRSSTCPGARSRQGSSTSTRTTTRRSSGIPPAAIVVSRRHDGGRRQLRVRHRADPTGAPRRDRRNARERRGHEPGDAGRGHRVGLRDVSGVPGVGPSTGTLLNFTAYCGHSALRLYVLGDAAYERAATADETERMCTLLDEAIAAGAAGFSTSFSFAHRGVDGKPVPSRFADRNEVEALFRAIGRAGKGVVLITPGKQCSYADVYEWQPRVGRPFTYPLFASPGGRHLEPVALHDAGLARGADVWPQVTPVRSRCSSRSPTVQPQRRDGVRRAAAARPRRPRSRPTGTPTGGHARPLTWPRRRCRPAGRRSSSPSPRDFPSSWVAGSCSWRANAGCARWT